MCGREAAGIITALAWQGHRPPDPWLERFSSSSLPLIPSLSGRSLAMLAYSLARLGHRPSRHWMQVYESTILSMGSEMNEKDSTSVFKAYHLMDRDLPTACAEVLNKAQGLRPRIEYQHRPMTSDLHQLVSLVQMLRV